MDSIQRQIKNERKQAQIRMKILRINYTSKKLDDLSERINLIESYLRPDMAVELIDSMADNIAAPPVPRPKPAPKPAAPVPRPDPTPVSPVPTPTPTVKSRSSIMSSLIRSMSKC